MNWTTTRRPRKSRIPIRNHSLAPCFNSLRFTGVSALAVNVTAGKSGLLGLPVGFQTRPSDLGLRDADTMGRCSCPFPALKVWVDWSGGALRRASHQAPPRPEATPEFLWKSSRKVRRRLVQSQFPVTAFERASGEALAFIRWDEKDFAAWPQYLWRFARLRPAPGKKKRCRLVAFVPRRESHPRRLNIWRDARS